MILGLDISTSKIGYCILDENKKIISNEFLKLKPLQLEDRAEIFYAILKDLKKKYPIREIFIEEPFSMFGGGRTTAKTMSKLQRFNGMCSFAVRRIFKVNPILIPANKARGLVGLKIKRGEDTKRKIIEWVEKKYPKAAETILVSQADSISILSALRSSMRKRLTAEAVPSPELIPFHTIEYPADGTIRPGLAGT